MGRPKKQFCPKGHDIFVTGRYKDGKCKACVSLQKQLYYITYKDDILNKGKIYYTENKENISTKRKDYYQIKRDEILAKKKVINALDLVKQIRHRYNHQYYEDNRELVLDVAKNYRQMYPEKIAAQQIKAQTNRNLRVVAWTDWDKIKEFYRNCPVGMVVDHVIPLQGKKVSGLHVSWNLQYLTPEENKAKYNNCDLNEVSERYSKFLSGIRI